MDFEILDDITRADVAFRAYGKSLNELFQSGGRALLSILLQNPRSIDPSKPVIFEVVETEIDLLYFEFLQEFIFYKDSEQLLLYPDEVEVFEEGPGFRLRCTCRGETIDRKKHRFNADIKAVTMHNLEIREDNGIWSATAVLDV